MLSFSEKRPAPAAPAGSGRNRRQLSPLAPAHPAHHVSGLRGLLLHPQGFNFAMPDMLASGMLDKADIGMLWTLFYLTYGGSKFVSGIISDRANPRYFMGLGLMATGVVNILFGLSSSPLDVLHCSGLPTPSSRAGAGPCSKLLTSWYSRTERGFWWSAWNTAHNVGGP